MNSEAELNFNKEEKEILFDIARRSINSVLRKDKFSIDEHAIPGKLKIPMGAFVSLKSDARLRGCIGRFISKDPLWEAVKKSAVSSAFEDPRFSPLSTDEYKGISIEITVLGPLKKISDKSEIILGKHGIYIKKDSRSGTMLPQVATEQRWTVDEFLGYTSREKAGLGWDGWKTADLFVYDGLVLKEDKS